MVRHNPPGPDTGSNRSLNAEFIRLTNTGKVARQLRGWRIHDGDANAYRFSRLWLPPGRAVTVHTGRGRDTATHRYWNLADYIWDNDGDIARLRRPKGVFADRCGYQRSESGAARC